MIKKIPTNYQGKPSTTEDISRYFLAHLQLTLKEQLKRNTLLSNTQRHS